MSSLRACIRKGDGAAAGARTTHPSRIPSDASPVLVAPLGPHRPVYTRGHCNYDPAQACNPEPLGAGQ